MQKLAASYLRETKIEVNVGETEELAANKAVSQEFFFRTLQEPLFLALAEQRGTSVLFAHPPSAPLWVCGDCWLGHRP